MTTIQKIVEVIPQFLSPYLGQLLYEVSILSARHDTEVTDQLQKIQPLTIKLKFIRYSGSHYAFYFVFNKFIFVVISSFTEFLKLYEKSAMNTIRH